jgi:23S rRNA (uridine2552-2'-O)-methyltransferase
VVQQTNKGTSGGGRRPKSQRVRTARGRKPSSTRWLQRQLNDPYVAEAQRLGFRSRAAFKLIEIDDRCKILKPGMSVVDLGAAPGGWTQVAVTRVKSQESGGTVVAMDIQEVAGITGAELLTGDFHDAKVIDQLRGMLGGPVDVVLSDLSPSTTGHRATDHIRIMALVEEALLFASEVLKPGGVFVAKVFKGGTEKDLLASIKRQFQLVRHVKPPASRSDSAETYLVAEGFRGDVSS